MLQYINTLGATGSLLLGFKLSLIFIIPIHIFIIIKLFLDFIEVKYLGNFLGKEEIKDEVDEKL